MVLGRSGAWVAKIPTIDSTHRKITSPGRPSGLGEGPGADGPDMVTHCFMTLELLASKSCFGRARAPAGVDGLVIAAPPAPQQPHRVQRPSLEARDGPRQPRNTLHTIVMKQLFSAAISSPKQLNRDNRVKQLASRRQCVSGSYVATSVPAGSPRNCSEHPSAHHNRHPAPDELRPLK